jgi:hypothetical protein
MRLLHVQLHFFKQVKKSIATGLVGVGRFMRAEKKVLSLHLMLVQ